MIKIEDLHKSFSGQHVLRGVSLEVRKGELVALIGSSGGGKSVLLKHVAGLVRADRGRVLVDGREIGKLRGAELKNLRARLGFLFQGGALFDSMTVFENIAFPLREKTRLSDQAIQDRVLGELEHVGLAGEEHKYPSQISGGMAKRVSLARALVREPEIMLFDEPTTGLDPVRGQSILKLIDASHKRLKFTGLVVTHEIPRVFQIVDRVAMLHQGVVIVQGSPVRFMGSDDPVVREFVDNTCEGWQLHRDPAPKGGTADPQRPTKREES